MLWSAAGIALLAGILLSFHSVGTMSRTNEILAKKASDATTLVGLQADAIRYRAIVQRYAQYPATPIPFEDVVKRTQANLPFATRSTETLPTISGWSARTVSVGFSNVSGTDLGRFLESGAAATPPWSLLECTLFASPTPGQLARAELAMGTVEQQK